MKSLSTIIATLILLTNLTGAAPTGQNHNPEDWPFGISTWTFKNFSLFEAIEKSAALDLKNIEAYQGQKLYNDSDLKITPDLDDRSITKIKAKLDKHNVTLTSIYIHSIPPDKAEHIFRFCKKLGVKTIVGEPKKEHLDTIETFCDKYEINLAIHNHATGKSDYSDPKEVARVCAGRSERIGACADTGHWQRSGFDPVECLRILEGRIISVHLKDLNKTEPKGHDVPWGTGKGQIVKTLSELNRQKVNPTIIAIEYEHNFDNSTPDIKKCIQFYNKTIAELADQGCVAGNNLAIYQEFLNDTAPTIVETVAEYTKDGVYVHKLKFLSRVSAGKNVIIYGILCKPVGDGPYPGLLNVHGGGGYADQMFSQVFDWAKRGYVAFCQDQPGICSFADMRSSGPFTSRDNFTVDPDATYSRLFDGVVAGLNGLRFIRSQPETDVNNVGVTGGSWGGYMTTMMSGLGQDRFKASFSVYGCGYYDVGSTWADEIESLDADDRIKWLDALDAGRKASQIQSNFFLTSPTNDWYFWPSGMMATFNDITSPKNFAIAANAMHYLTRGAGFHGGTDSSRAQPHRTYMEIQWMDYHLKGIGDPFGSCTAGTVTRDGNNARVEFTYTGVNPEENALIYYAYGETPFISNYWRSVPVTSQGGGTYSGLIPIYDTELPIIWFGSAHDILGADLREYTCSTTYQTFNPTALGFTAAERRDEYFVEDFEGNKERWKKPTFKSYPGNYTYGSTAAHSGSYGLRLTGEQTLRCDGMRGAAWEKFADGIKMWVKNPGGTSLRFN